MEIGRLIVDDTHSKLTAKRAGRLEAGETSRTSQCEVL